MELPFLVCMSLMDSMTFHNLGGCSKKFVKGGGFDGLVAAARWSKPCL